MAETWKEQTGSPQREKRYEVTGTKVLRTVSKAELEHRKTKLEGEIARIDYDLNKIAELEA